MIDQSYIPPDIFVSSLSFNLGSSLNQPISQSFTPSFTSLDYIEVYFLGISRFVPESEQVVRLSLIEGSAPSGNTLTTSSDISLQIATGELVNEITSPATFIFNSSVSVIPGELYNWRLDYISGGGLMLTTFGDGYSSGGLTVGSIQISDDFPFAVGTLASVPEPGNFSILFSLVTLGLCILKRKSRNRANKALEPTRMLVSDRAPSSTLRAK